ncbi:ASPIC/UnbV domain protein [Opitutus terrae PB90-1]|uniref:ASPIC/UnbV domain protein n=2 Tax=Opitutus terrae TaxID=107709 RepID=B1ZY86_OPITP|nr:ASPIC/UnbV domain protein [Opitutus terrae PB90-1]
MGNIPMARHGRDARATTDQARRLGKPTFALTTMVAFAILTAPLVLAASAPWPQFTDVTESAGIAFKHGYGDLELNNIVEATGPGCCVFDYNNDGLMDVYFVNGRWHPDVSDNRGRSLKGKLANALYRNNGDGTFTDVTAAAGVAGRVDSYGMAASAADYDNDGHLDLYVCNYGSNLLYHNNGDGTFTDVTEKAGVLSPGWSLAAPWFDYDGDGRLDLFVVHYLDYDKGAFQRTGAYYKADNFPGPLSYPGLPDHLYRNNGDGTFTDVTEATGLWEPTGRGMGAVACDLDGDGDVDLYVTNDAMPNNLWINDGRGHFTDQGMETNTAFGEGGQGVSSMGPFVADVDRDGRLDILVPDMGYSSLMLQKQPRFFTDVTAQSGVAVLCGQYTGWGGLLNDYDNDGYADLFIANGDPHHTYVEEAVIARWDGQSKFVDMARVSGDFFNHKYVGRGAAFADFDNDGDLDIVMNVIGDLPRVLRNDGGNARHWLKLAPLRADTGLIALNATVTVKAGGLTMIQPVLATNGYLTASDPRPNFGLGDATAADSVEIRWPDGTRQKLTDVMADQILTVKHGTDDGAAHAEPSRPESAIPAPATVRK